MSVEWPAALPLPQFGLRYNVVDPQVRTLMASGRTISRRRFSDVPTEFSARWMLRQSEAKIFEQFYQNDAVDGSEWIGMPLVGPRGEDVFFVRFRGAYQYRRVGADLWEYSANMQMYGSPYNSIPPPGFVSSPPGVPSDAVNVTYLIDEINGGWSPYFDSGLDASFSPVYQSGDDYFGGWEFSGTQTGQRGLISSGNWASALPPGSTIFVYFKTVISEVTIPNGPSVTYSVQKSSLISRLEVPRDTGPGTGRGGTHYYLLSGVIPTNTVPITMGVSPGGATQFITSIDILYVGIKSP